MKERKVKESLCLCVAVGCGSKVKRGVCLGNIFFFFFFFCAVSGDRLDPLGWN